MTGGTLVLMALAAAGSAAASIRAADPLLRLAHAVMAMVMLTMITAPVSAVHVASVVNVAALAVAAAAVFGHYVVHANGLPCAVDLAGMCLLLGVLALTTARLAVVLLLALGWLISSIWAHGEWALKTRLSGAIALEASAAATWALAMALMAVSMAS